MLETKSHFFTAQSMAYVETNIFLDDMIFVVESFNSVGQLNDQIATRDQFPSSIHKNLLVFFKSTRNIQPLDVRMRLNNKTFDMKYYC